MSESTQTINQALLDALDKYAGKPCLYVKRNRLFQSVAYRQLRTEALRLAHYFRRSGAGDGERVAVIARNTAEWLTAYIAAHLAGSVIVPIQPTLPVDQIRAILADTGTVLAVVQGDNECLLVSGADVNLPDLKTVLVVEEFAATGPGLFPLRPILTQPIAPDIEEALVEQALAITPNTLTAIHYTNCDDGHMRGAMFDQGQVLTLAQSTGEWFRLDDEDLGFSTPQLFSDLPSLNAVLNYLLMGVPNALAEGEETSFEDLQQVSPTVTLTTPYAFEFIYLYVMQEMEQLPRSSQEVFQWALTVGKDYHAAGLTASPQLRESYERADMTFFSSIRGMMGGRLRRLFSTGAPLPQQWIEFAEAIGLLPLDVYAVTKAGGCPAASRRSARRAGSCGRIAPGFQIRIAGDGEVLVRGETVMRGYWKDPVATRQVIDSEGWLHTGDLGRFDADGYLYLTGHKQSPLLLATGRKVLPGIIEDGLLSSPFVDQALVCGSGRRYISALIVPDLVAVQQHLSVGGKIGYDEQITVQHAAVAELMESVVQSVNATLDSWETVEQYTLLDEPFHDAKGQPVANPKLQRAEILRLYADQLAAMYPTAAPFESRPVQQVQLHPEHLRQLLEKEGILDAWMNDAGIGFLFELARAKHIDAPSMVHICETVAAIAQIQNEEKPLSTALIVGNPARIARVLPESALQLRQYDHIRRMRRAVTMLAKIVDGQVLAFAVDNHGFLRGIHRLGITLDYIGSDLTGSHFRHHAAISRQCDAVVFSIPPGGRQARVFADGQLVGRYVSGSWLAENTAQIDAAVERLAERKGYDLELLRRMLRCAFRMSERNLGAILLVGDADAIMRRSDNSEIQNVASVVSIPVVELSDEELITFAKQDGATVVDARGELRGCMVLLRPAASTRAQIGPGKGARHSSAAKMSAETNCVAITVSQDGPIAVYDSGQRVLSL